MTELSPVSHTTPDAGHEPPGAEGYEVPKGSVGYAIPNTECRLVDPATGEDAAEGERGELWIRGPQVMKGYLNNERGDGARPSTPTAGCTPATSRSSTTTASTPSSTGSRS